MTLSITLIIVVLVTATSAKVTTLYLSELCPETPGGTSYLSLGDVAESFNSTAVIVAAPPNESKHMFGYDFNVKCKLEVSAPPGHHIVASVRRLQLRGNCFDNLTIYDDHQKHEFCGLKYDAYEAHSISFPGLMILQFVTGNLFQGNTYISTGFQLTVTAYKAAPCNTTTEFSCGNGRCIAQELNCSENNHCGDHSNQQCAPATHISSNCSTEKFTCANGRCLPPDVICDGYDNCGDLSDELNCTHTCDPDEFTCANGNCIYKGLVCNGRNDCWDFSDEVNCSYTCQPRQFTCKNGECVSSLSVCDKYNDCGDWSDEENCTYTCQPRQFTCKNGECVSSLSVCDKYNDCGDWSDEENCTYTCSLWEFSCSNGNCVLRSQRCDKNDDCGDGSDEENCNPIDTVQLILIINAAVVLIIIIIITAIAIRNVRDARNGGVVHRLLPHHVSHPPATEEFVNPLCVPTVPTTQSSN